MGPHAGPSGYLRVQGDDMETEQQVAEMATDAAHGAAAAVPMPPAAAPVEPVPPAASMPAPQMPAPVAARLPDEPAKSLADIELRTIQQAVDAAGGNISVAAKRLGISRNTIYRKLRWRSDGR